MSKHIRNRPRMRRCAWALLGVLTPVLTFASVSSDLSSFFDDAGFTGNVTNPSVYQGQEAGYYSAGSVFMQSPSHYLQPVGVTVPSLNMGCGGMDLFTGGMSFVSSAQLEQFAQSVMSNAVGYTMHLALQTWAPQIETTLKFIQDEAQQINQFGMSSCEAAQALVGGAASMMGLHSTQVCSDLAAQQNAFGDWVSAKEGCTTGQQSSSVFANAKSSGQSKNQFVPNTNVAWEALQNYGLAGDDVELAEFLMTLSGTIVVDNDGNPHYYPPEYSNGEILNTLLDGGTAQNIYTCGDPDDGCLDITRGSITITNSTALKSTTSKYLSDIWQAMAQDQPLNTNLQAFLSNVSFSIMTTFEAAKGAGVDPNTIIISFSDYLSYYLLNEYLMNALQTVSAAAGSLNMSAEELQKFTDGITQGQQAIRSNLTRAASEFTTQLEVMEQTFKLQTQAMGKANARQITNVTFESGE